MTREERSVLEGFTDIDIGESEYCVIFSDYERILNEWLGTNAFITTRTLYDEKITIKRASIISVTLVTAESYSERCRQDREMKEKELTGEK